MPDLSAEALAQAGPDLYAEFISVPHLLPQQWDALQTTLNHLPNPSVDVAKTCFAVRFLVSPTTGVIF